MHLQGLFGAADENIECICSWTRLMFRIQVIADDLCWHMHEDKEWVLQWQCNALNY